MYQLHNKSKWKLSGRGRDSSERTDTASTIVKVLNNCDGDPDDDCDAWQCAEVTHPTNSYFWGFAFPPFL